MTRALTILRAGPCVTVQDLGRPGYLGQGMSQGGAADRHALAEGAMLLAQQINCAALELAGSGGEFQAATDLRFALTGAQMPARIDGEPVQWNASHTLRSGQRLSIGVAVRGSYGYLHLAGGIATPLILGSRSAHLAGGIGRRLVAGDVVPVGPDQSPDHPGMILSAPDRCAGGTIRVLASVHTDLFAPETRQRFAQTYFAKTLRANRQGAELAMEGAPFAAKGALGIPSEPMIPGDIQMTGDGRPFILLPECQTTGGYPRIGAVMPDDLSSVAQADPHVSLQFHFVGLAEAMLRHVPLNSYAASLRDRIRPLGHQSPDYADLLRVQLISGAVTGWDET